MRQVGDVKSTATVGRTKYIRRSRLYFGNKSKLRWQRKPNSLGIHQNRKVAGRSRYRAIWVVCTYYARWFDSPRLTDYG
jgi:hypothetical protein